MSAIVRAARREGRCRPARVLLAALLVTTLGVDTAGSVGAATPEDVSAPSAAVVDTGRVIDEATPEDLASPSAYVETVDHIRIDTLSYCGGMYIVLYAPPANWGKPHQDFLEHLPMTVTLSDPARGLAPRQVTVLHPNTPEVADRYISPVVQAADPSGRGPGLTVRLTWAGGDVTVQTTPYSDSCPGSFLPIEPIRMLDTRYGVGTTEFRRVRAGETVEVDVAAALPPFLGGATAVVANITATNPTADGFVTAHPCGEARPTSSNLNFSAGDTIPTLAIIDLVGVWPSGKACLYTLVETDLLLDVTGFYVNAPYGRGSGAKLQPLDSPVRLADTRGAATKIAAGESRRVPVAGVQGLADDAVAVSLNVTATEPDASGFLTVYPCGTPVPVASNVNVVAGQTRPNAAIVGVGDGGDVCVYAHMMTHVIVDAVGAYRPTAQAGRFYWSTVANAFRRWDTRREGTRGFQNTSERLPSMGVLRVGFPWLNQGDVVNLTVTVTETEAPGFVVAYPCERSSGGASNLNFVAGETIANTVQVSLGPSRFICLFTNATTHLVVDHSGTYVTLT